MRLTPEEEAMLAGSRGEAVHGMLEGLTMDPV